MCPSPADAITEPAPPPESGEGVPEDPVVANSRLKPRLRAVVILLVVAVLVGIFLSIGMKKTSGARGTP